MLCLMVVKSVAVSESDVLASILNEEKINYFPLYPSVRKKRLNS